jgi:hypothetical protein
MHAVPAMVSSASPTPAHAFATTCRAGVRAFDSEDAHFPKCALLVCSVGSSVLFGNTSPASAHMLDTAVRAFAVTEVIFFIRVFPEATPDCREAAPASLPEAYKVKTQSIAPGNNRASLHPTPGAIFTASQERPSLALEFSPFALLSLNPNPNPPPCCPVN